MKILLLHNYYQVAGGEDGVFLNEVALLKNKGHKVVSCSVDNTSITSVFNKFCLFFSSVFSFSQYRKVKQVLRAEVPDVVHVHNYFPMFSPSIFFACKKLNIPVVAIGGITPENGKQLVDNKADFLAIISGIYASTDIINSVKAYKNLFY
jgi:hypothetical protein